MVGGGQEPGQIGVELAPVAETSQRVGFGLLGSRDQRRPIARARAISVRSTTAIGSELMPLAWGATATTIQWLVVPTPRRDRRSDCSHA